MCKDNLGCATDQDCGCGCKDCSTNKQSPSVARQPDVSTSLVPSSGYVKPTPEDYMTETLPSGSSGYSKKNIMVPSGYNKKEIVKTYLAKEIVVPIPKAQQKQDNTGVYVAGGFLFVLMLFAGKDKKKK